MTGFTLNPAGKLQLHPEIQYFHNSMNNIVKDVHCIRMIPFYNDGAWQVSLNFVPENVLKLAGKLQLQPEICHYRFRNSKSMQWKHKRCNRGTGWCDCNLSTDKQMPISPTA